MHNRKFQRPTLLCCPFEYSHIRGNETYTAGVITCFILPDFTNTEVGIWSLPTGLKV